MMIPKTPLEFLRKAMRVDNSPALNKAVDEFLEHWGVEEKTDICLNSSGDFTFVLDGVHEVEGEMVKI